MERLDETVGSDFHWVVNFTTCQPSHFSFKSMKPFPTVPSTFGNFNLSPSPTLPLSRSLLTPRPLIAELLPIYIFWLPLPHGTKRRNFQKNHIPCQGVWVVFPSSEIYDGLSAVYDYGQNGVELKNNIRQYWWKSMVQFHENIVGIDAAIFMHPTTWKASGHVDAFSDPLIDNRDSKKRYRADVLVED